MTDEVTETVVDWIIGNVDVNVIPIDEGDEDALVYNLVHLARDGRDFEHYNYESAQDAEIETWRLGGNCD